MRAYHADGNRLWQALTTACGYLRLTTFGAVRTVPTERLQHVDGTLVNFTHKAQREPLALSQALIALGRRMDVRTRTRGTD